MEKITLRQVTKTLDYDLFVMHDQNRAVVGSDGCQPRKDLIESMKKNGFLETGHIICTIRPDKRVTIIEGHNRFITAKHLGIPVWFSAHEPSAEASPMKHSQTIKTWTCENFAAGHAQDEQDYAEVMNYHRKTGIPLMACFSMYAGLVASSSGTFNAAMKRGTYKIKNRELPFEVSRIIEALGKYVGFSCTQNLVTAISRAFFAEGFCVKRMIERINKNPELIKKCRLKSDYEKMLEDIYNRNMKTERFHLQIEIEKAMKRRSLFQKS